MNIPVQQRRLIVMRHAKAEPHHRSDHSRELTARGVADASEAGRFLRVHDLVPDHALVSTAARTRGTWKAVAAGSGSAATAEFLDGLYDAGADDALDTLRAASDDVRVLIVIGHNPTMAYLAHELSDGAGEPAAVAALAQGYPTSALTVFDLKSGWEDLARGHGTISRFHVGRG
ncbi:MAG: histidine phosphatase family protein [Nocardioidaceae bacterium]|nr:MAG: histidine phosphatase family protein [Nocardioidaceae bacterium]